MSEGQCLSENLETYEADSGVSFFNRNHDNYLINKASKIGSSIKCAECGKVFTKKQYSQAFCSPKVIRGRKVSVCKDKYHNAQPHR